MKQDNSPKLTPLNIALIYAVFSGIWILVSDRWVKLAAPDLHTAEVLSTLKGWLFVLVTAVLLYFLIRRAVNALKNSEASLARQFSRLEEAHAELEATYEELVEAQAEVAAGEARYRAMFEHMMSAVAVYEVRDNGQDFVFRDINPAAEQIDGLVREETVGRSLLELYAEADIRGFLAAFRQVWRTGESVHFPATFYEDGRLKGWRENEIYKLPSGEIVAIFNDVTSQKEAEEALWQEKEKAQVTLDSIGDAVITTDTRGRVDYLNPRAEQLTGRPARQAPGLPIEDVFPIVHEESGNPVENPVQRCLREGRIVGLANHTVLVHPDGRRIPIEDTAAPIRNRNGQIVGSVLVFHDVSKNRKLLRQLTHQAYHDSLTGLPNRHLFNEHLRQALAHAQRLHCKSAVLFLDIDRFKLINDTLGHSQGDVFLREASARISRVLRSEDTVSRWGGDEFVILLPELSQAEHAAKAARKIIRAFATPFRLNRQEIFVTPSIGISLYPDDGALAEELIKQADTAMYRAKELGGGRYQFFTDSLNQLIKERMTIENLLRKALERAELVLYYQPQVDLLSGAIVGVEALLRWHTTLEGLSPEGLVMPGTFIPAAEETGLIIPIGWWVLRSACAQSRAWRTQGYPPLRMAVNISARQLRDGNFIRDLQEIIAAGDLDPEWLELEITESVIIENAAATVELLQQIKRLGVRISLDDFGTGYSSLNYLRRLPIDTLKIDKSFIENIALDTKGAKVVTGIIQLAHSLDLTVLAEGVETPAQRLFLLANRCDVMQGFLFSRPVPAEEMERLLAGINSVVPNVF
ncbi:diguanylate cyclase (GGDEF) domain protein [Acididesulfobacillus acetoxydans]|uniref:Diguanylate cyclase (GGDEF) domain protein n=1 Tax=Acididesulfobacillus acetoxydans TaxID=1561005 RepID=A0A8S0XA81_9FIRM|nr:EAL domain-containing protein [Acididesulfobacillus acetoxydans]CAA7599556.1 diguanylate cyclase (GGDEF) domain protein [Acididesulfobacillus acetoxydans]CEJ07751.1 Signaling protein YkoW [Acididesulfobacillus acetoxydans]